MCVLVVYQCCKYNTKLPELSEKRQRISKCEREKIGALCNFFPPLKHLKHEKIIMIMSQNSKYHV